VECDYLWLCVIVCDAHNAVWCGRNERECESRERERGQEEQCIVKVLFQIWVYVRNYDPTLVQPFIGKVHSV
jgi:hypothetical protein